MHTTRLVSGALAAVLALAACDGSSTSPDTGAMNAAEVDALAAGFDELATVVIDAQLGLPLFAVSASDVEAAAVPVDETFSRTKQCPRGGTVTVQGRTTGTVDRATRSATRVTTATRTEAACAVDGRNGAVLTLTGNPNVALRAEHSVTNGVPGRSTMTQKGSFTWARSTGQSGTCPVDLASAHDPATRTVTITGTFCNRTINVTRTRT